MVDDTYGSQKVYMKQGGDEQVVASGGKITVESGGVLDASGAAAGAVKLPAGEIAAADLATDAVETTKIKALAVTQAKIATASLDGTIAKVAANANAIGGVQVVHRIDVADATGDTDVTLTHKTRVIDAWAVKTGAVGGAGDTVTVKNGANAITDALDLNAADKTVVRAGTIDDAQHEIAASGTLRCSAAKSTNAACTVYVLGIRVA